jgi:pyruvate kinase
MLKILPTIGPASNSINSLRKILKFTNTVRLNGSHNNVSWHVKTSINIKKLNPNCKILIDLPGIKPRTENFDKVIVNKNQKVIFFYKKKPTISQINYKTIFIKISKPLPKYTNIKFFSVSDGKYILKFTRKGQNYIEGISLQYFVLLPRKGLNIPGSLYSNKEQIKLYFSFIKKIKKVKFDAIGLSFIQDEFVLKILRKKFPELILVSKIENLNGLKNVNKITDSSDIVMIDRGDLSAEIGDTKLFDAIITISKACKFFGKPLIMATENLESMMINSAPSKSEIVSLAFSHQIQADLIMLSDETATSSNYLKILFWLKNFIISLNSRNVNSNFKSLNFNEDIFNNIFQNLKNTSLIIFTKKGYIINKILKINSDIKIYIFSDSRKIITQSFFRSNCQAFLTKKFPKNMEKFIYSYVKKNKVSIFNKASDIFLTYVNYPNKGSRANTLSLINKKSFI